jgi:predicted transcriptional regulator
MAETTTITVRIPLETKERLDKLAAATRRSRSFLATEALGIYTRYELEIVEGILEGLEDTKAGRVVTTEEMQADLNRLFGEFDEAESRSAAQRKRASGE